MLILGILASIAAIGFLCWLLFTLAVFALPLFAGVSIGTWAYGTGAGWPGAILIGLVGAALTLGIGQFLLIVVRPLWIRLLVAAAFVLPAAIAGFHATHGIVKHTMPSETWQVIFSVSPCQATRCFWRSKLAGACCSPSSPIPPVDRLWMASCHREPSDTCHQEPAPRAIRNPNGV